MASILVVEDGDSMARVLTHYLGEAGHTPVVAPNGMAALREAAARPDLILLDLELSDLSGAEVLGRLKRQPETAYIPVVVLSARPDPAACVAKVGGHAVAAVLRKPVLFPELYAVVDAVLSAPAEWGSGNRTATRQQVRLIFRLITEGSEPLVRQVCARLDTDRGRRHGDMPGRVRSWMELARAGRQEGLLSEEEGALVAGCPASLVDAH